MKSRRDAQREFQAPTLQPSKKALEVARKLPFAAIRDVARALDAFATRRAAEAHSEWSKYDQAVREAGWDAAIKALQATGVPSLILAADYLKANKPEQERTQQKSKLEPKS